MYKGPERRKYIRIYDHFLVCYPTRSWVQQGIIPAGWNLVISENLSAGGALFYSVGRPDIHSLIDLRIFFPAHKKPVKCVGKVIRVEEKNVLEDMKLVAVSFVEIKDREKSMIEKIANGPFFREKKTYKQHSLC